MTGRSVVFSVAAGLSVGFMAGCDAFGVWAVRVRAEAEKSRAKEAKDRKVDLSCGLALLLGR